MSTEGYANLKRVFEQATKADRREAFYTWTKMHSLTSEIADKYGFTPRLGAAVFAALSPNNDYHGNLRDTDRLLRAACSGLSLDDFKVSTYGANKRKAWRMAQGEEPLDLLKFPKTRNFFLNVSDPCSPVPVTIDGHMFNAWRGKREPLKAAAHRANLVVYEQAAQDVRLLAKEKGLLPNQTQSCVWFTWRRLHGILFKQQLELWDREALASGLGFVPLMESRS